MRYIHDATNLIQHTIVPTSYPTVPTDYYADLFLSGTIVFARVSVEQFYTSGLEDFLVDYIARTCGVDPSQVRVLSAVEMTALQTHVSFEITWPDGSAVNATEVEAWRESLERAGFSSVEAFARETIDGSAVVEEVWLVVLEVAPCFSRHAKCGGNRFQNDFSTECCRGYLCKWFDDKHSQCESCAQRDEFLEQAGKESKKCCAGLEPCLVNRGGKEWGHACKVAAQCQPPPSPPWCGGMGFQGENGGVCPAGEVCQVVSELYHGCVPHNHSEQGGISMEMYGVIGAAAAFSLASLVGFGVCRKTLNRRRNTLKSASLELKDSASAYTAKQLNDEISVLKDLGQTKNMGSVSSLSDVRVQNY